MAPTPSPLSPCRQPVLIADREFPIRVGILTVLAQEPGLLLPTPASTIAELTALACKHPTALIVMDTCFSDGNGIDACHALLAQHHGLRILFFANSAPPQLIAQAIDAGATGFLVKTVTQMELRTSIRRMLAGEPVFDPILMNETLQWVREQQQTNAMPLPRLSPRHQQLLPLLSKGLTNKEIGSQLNLSEKTVKNYLADLFDRLHMSRRAQVAAWFIGQTGQQPPLHDIPTAARRIWSHARPRTLNTKEPLHAHHSPY